MSGGDGQLPFEIQQRRAVAAHNPPETQRSIGGDGQNRRGPLPPPEGRRHTLMACSPRRRFAVLNRDNFTCQYCGRRPPHVTLQIDHIKPKSRGGSDKQENLITACADCNQGKAARIINGILDERLLAPCPACGLCHLISSPREQEPLRERTATLYMHCAPCLTTETWGPAFLAWSRS